MANCGHGHFAAYHERFNHKEETDSHVMCGRRRALLKCKRTHKGASTRRFWEAPEGVAVFAQWAPATGLFSRRYGGVDGAEQGVLE